MKGRVDPTSRFRRLAVALALGSLATAVSAGCGALLLIGGAGTGAIAFATGELHAQEDTSLSELEIACGAAIERLGYKDVQITQEEKRIGFRAVTPGGEPVQIRLKALGPDRTDVRIRIGVFGDEAVSRLVLEEIHQSL